MAGTDLGMLKGDADTVQGRRKQFCIGTGTAESNFFTFIIQFSEFGSRTTFVLCPHCQLVDYHSDVLELAILWAYLTVTVML